MKKERADACLFGIDVVCCGCGWCWVRLGCISYRRDLDAVFPKTVCSTEQGVSVALVFARCLIPQVCCCGLCRVGVPTARTKGVCLFILGTNERLVQHAPHHYTIKALDRPWSNAGVFDVLL